MQSTYEQYTSGFHMISLLTHLDVQLMEQGTPQDYRKRKKGNQTSSHKVPLESDKDEGSERGSTGPNDHSLGTASQGIQRRQLTRASEQV